MSFKKKIGFISLGCDKNRVDTENIITKLSRKEFEIVGNAEDANIIIINTCAFLGSAREEAIQTIQEMSKYKNCGNLEKLIVVGCLPLLLKDKLLEEHKEIDCFVLPEDYERIDEIIFNLYNQKYEAIKSEKNSRRLTTPLHYAYVKIADGCNNRCAFCKIPFIRGNYKSRKIDDILEEVELLVANGVKEIILVAQDVTRFGLENKESLVMLLKELARIKKLVWIRLLYCYPDLITDELIEEIANNPKVVHYLDIPLQHVSNHVLVNMKRRSRKRDIVELINKLRRKIPDIKIRTTFMVGFPNETKRDFKELCGFLKIFKLDNVGFFKFSREEGTLAYDMEGQIEESVKDKRLEIVQMLQEKIISKKNRKLKGHILKVIIDDKVDDVYIARPYFSAPDVDFYVEFESKLDLKPGNFVDVLITNFKDGIFLAKNEKNSTY